MCNICCENEKLSIWKLSELLFYVYYFELLFKWCVYCVIFVYLYFKLFVFVICLFIGIGFMFFNIICFVKNIVVLLIVIFVCFGVFDFLWFGVIVDGWY